MTRDELRAVVARALAKMHCGDPDRIIAMPGGTAIRSEPNGSPEGTRAVFRATAHEMPAWRIYLAEADAALSAIEGEHVIVPVDRCVVTGNPCGTDTVLGMAGVECPRPSGKCKWKE